MEFPNALDRRPLAGIMPTFMMIVVAGRLRSCEGFSPWSRTSLYLRGAGAIVVVGVYRRQLTLTSRESSRAQLLCALHDGRAEYSAELREEWTFSLA
jgi:hypothetical protein